MVQPLTGFPLRVQYRIGRVRYRRALALARARSVDEILENSEGCSTEQYLQIALLGLAHAFGGYARHDTPRTR